MVARSRTSKSYPRLADAGDWKRFTELMGGPVARRDERPIAVARVWSDEPGRYLEPKGYCVVGVAAAGR